MGDAPSRLVTVEPPYDEVFISLRRQLAPSAIFTYDRRWIMTDGQLAAILGHARSYLDGFEKKFREVELAAAGGKREDRLELRYLKTSIASLKAVVHWLENPQEWEPPSEEADARLIAEYRGEAAETCDTQ